jgi:hypothetical protein
MKKRPTSQWLKFHNEPLQWVQDNSIDLYAESLRNGLIDEIAKVGEIEWFGINQDITILPQHPIRPGFKKTLSIN